MTMETMCVCVCVPGVHEEEEVERHGRLKNENLLPAFSNPAVHFFWNVFFCCFFFIYPHASNEFLPGEESKAHPPRAMSCRFTSPPKKKRRKKTSRRFGRGRTGRTPDSPLIMTQKSSLPCSRGPKCSAAGDGGGEGGKFVVSSTANTEKGANLLGVRT